jgi:multidrug resistance efflux pump
VIALSATAAVVGLLFALRAGWESLVYVSSTEATIEAEMVTVATPVEARIAELLVKSGDRVERGQVLARHDREALAALAQQAQADLAAKDAALHRAEADLQAMRYEMAVEGKKAQATLKSAQASVDLAKSESTRITLSGPERVRQAQAQLEQAKAELAQAERNRPELIAEGRAEVAEAEAVAQRAQKEADRKTQLREMGYISVAELDAARSELDIANARLTAARERLKRVESGSQEELIKAARQRVAAMEAMLRLAGASRYETASSKHEVALREADMQKARADLERTSGLTANLRMREEDVAAAQAEVDRARAALAASRKALAEAEIKSPVSGVVAATLVHEGELVERGKPLLLLIDRSKPYWVKALFPEHRVARIRPGQSAIVWVTANGRSFRGRVEAVGDVAASRNPASMDDSGRQRPTGSAAQVAVRIRFDDRGLRMIPGLSARISIRVR